jgi:uncharacterized protein (TIGR02594 family)
MEIARSQLGVREIRGSKDNSSIVAYHSTTTLSADDDETHWCASFVNWVMEQAGFNGNDSARAKDWARWGSSCGLNPGAVTVIYNRKSGGYHVGFYVKGCEGQLTLLGGNQGDQVKYSTFGSNYEIVATRMPSNVC